MGSTAAERESAEPCAARPLFSFAANVETAPSFAPDGLRMIFHNEATNNSNSSAPSGNELTMVENVVRLFATPGATPQLTRTAAVKGGKTTDFAHPEWRRNP